MDTIFELVGMKFRGGLAVELVNGLKTGDKIQLQREPENKYDPNAIKVLMGKAKVFVAYVRKDAAMTMAGQMDKVIETMAENYEQTGPEDQLPFDPSSVTFIATITSVVSGPKGNLVFAQFTLN